MKKQKQVLLLAAENGALPRGKVGGIGDVIRDLPIALAKQGWTPVVMTPAYGMFANSTNAILLSSIKVEFSGNTHSVAVFQVAGPDDNVQHIVLDSPLFSPLGEGLIYCDDGANAPFESDATKFAFFCTAAAKCIVDKIVSPVVIHCHDWHAALILALREYSDSYSVLKKITTVFTIHNLALQGIRPLLGHESSFESWFPGLKYELTTVVDPRYHDCINPMAIAIRLADKVNTVSPTYAREILQANNPELGFYGGEGLERDLQIAANEKRLSGILNGCEYPTKSVKRPSWKSLRDSMLETLTVWMSESMHIQSAHYLAQSKLISGLKKKPTSMLVSIGRITSQKVGLFLQQTSNGNCALVDILNQLEEGELFIMLGSGDPDAEAALTRISALHPNFLFLKGYANDLPELLYAAGDLFLMPSNFEPCGISQMLAMRAGQACVVHGVGGLKDTVEHFHNGFVFNASSPTEQAHNFVTTVKDALALKNSDSQQWKTIKKNAQDTRFDWEKSAQTYSHDLYAK